MNTREKFELWLEGLDNDPNHREAVQRDSYGNVGRHRIASHDGADYYYVSSWYGVAMESYSSKLFTDEQLLALMNGQDVEVSLRIFSSHKLKRRINK
jgi:hypothetical protein